MPLNNPTDIFDAAVIGAVQEVRLRRSSWLRPGGRSFWWNERSSLDGRFVGNILSATNWPLLKRLGLAESFAEMAGPPVVRTAIFVGDNSVQADLPTPCNEPWGRALSREHLDSLFLARRRVRVGTSGSRGIVWS